MQISLDEFCELVKKLKKTNAEKAFALLWYFDQVQVDSVKSAGELTKLFDDHHIGSPNSTWLGGAMASLKLGNKTSAGFRLKPGSRQIIREWLGDLDGIQPKMDHELGYLPQSVWKNTRGYIEAVSKEVNGCFRSAYYNAAAVMLRRLIETLIIEAYENTKRDSEIKDVNGNYIMLGDLVDRACGERGHPGLNLSRNSKSILKEARDIGNFSAHARRYIAHATDLVKLKSGVRVLVQELLHIADLPRR